MTNSYLDPQPAPNDNSGDIWMSVIDDMKYRRQQGIEKYGVTLSPFNGRKSLVDAYQEALDLCVYLKQKLIEEYTMQAAVAVNPFKEDD